MTSSSSFINRLKALFSSKGQKEKNETVPNSVDLIDDHLNEFFSKDDDIVVYHEILSETIHRDVFFIKAREERPYHILLSCGMSALPMSVPEEYDASKYAEVMMLLPKEWNLEEASFRDERNFWPIRIIKELMMLPHSNNTWLGYGHSYGFSDAEEYADGVGFNSVLLVHSMELSEEFIQIKREDDDMIEIFTLIPLYKEEIEFKMEHGTSALLEKFDEFQIEEVVRLGRKNVCI